MQNKFRIKLFLPAFLSLGIISGYSQQKNYLPYVNPFIGTGGHAHTFPGACYPFGMMQLSPDTRLTGWDGCSGYHYSDSIIYGFSHTHLSGTGCSDYGDILLMPISKEITYFPKSSVFIAIGDYSSLFSHKDEKASPGYYSVILKNGNIKAELAVGQYAGIHRYTYTKDSICKILLDLNHRNKIISSEFHKISDTEVCGYIETTAWAKDRKVYYDIRFSKPLSDYWVFKDHEWQDHLHVPRPKDMSGTDIQAIFSFGNSSNIILSKIGISAVSIENAKENLEQDIPAWDFDGTLKKTQKTWNDYLNKIEVTSKNDSLLTTFYTALYHTAIHPSLYTDVNGQYRGRDMKIHTTTAGNPVYTVFSIWDTYRALNPLFTIIDSSKERQFIQTFLRQYEQGGSLPVWELSANETNCMIGFHSVSVIYDAYQKGIRGFDANEALTAMEHSADADVRGLPALRQYGYIPADKSSESVSQTLECGYDYWCVAQMAKALGKTNDYEKYIGLSQGYKNVYNPENGFMQGRANGAFVKPFDPKAVTFNYTEANAWQYNFYVPHDMNGFIDLHGGKEKLATMLDSLFTTSSKTTGSIQPDITGMIGQYAQGNEPSHHIAYLYNYVGQPWKTAKYIHKIEKLYTNSPDGICGNDDCGELSAWYVMSAIGMYQVCPGDGQFELTSPLFDTIKIHLESGKTFVISSEKSMVGDDCIESSTLNKKDYSNSFLRYTDLMKGGTLNYTFTKVNRLSAWGTGNNVPKDFDSIPGYEKIVTAPYFENGETVFTDSILISLHTLSANETVRYAISDPTKTGEDYLLLTKITSTPFIFLNHIALMFGLRTKMKDAEQSKTVIPKFPKAGK
ncbi:MAG TPA: GH92 family glycosyl hydrolase [Bacteroidia bacterium]|nr:GH92 family glycosyl hydrolase [Bacteroidia bacterium]